MDIQNPEKIEIEGLKTIHKLCKFGADHNMEGCSFTEIVERMFDELSKTQAITEGFVLVPREPTDEMIEAFSDGYMDSLFADFKGASRDGYKAMIEAQEQGYE
ncbi:hypothetical protein [Acinetobacter piscicola]|uniref:hypothetical protein n=1 Tax=Acinetobacter piscicola TaxID=2006115 RepID=UPI001021ED3A|nr:hypothetical protein [Acinetobacter piscicola]RYL25077.1 hypothetical protein EWP19_12890 [Acinetobacter piscicola]